MSETRKTKGGALPRFPAQTGDLGKERKRYGHDFPFFAWKIPAFMPVHNARLVILYIISASYGKNLCTVLYYSH